MLTSLTPDQEKILTRAFFKMSQYAPHAELFEQDGGKDNLPDHCKKALDLHLMNRLDKFRNDHVPWMDAIRPLNEAKVLEIGAGTGSSSVALAEKGAIVDAIDNEAGPLEMARARCKVHEIDTVNVQVGDAAKIDEFDKIYDYVIFFASFEHLTFEERLTSLRMAWEMLSKGGALVIIECPNRLWYHDQHTALTDFYHWLPDDLAIDYSKFISRSGFHSSFEGKSNEDNIVRLARWGRGASYHDLEVVLGPLADLDIRDSLTDFLRTRDEKISRHWEDSRQARYRETMMHLAPKVPGQFFYPWLDLVIIK